MELLVGERVDVEDPRWLRHGRLERRALLPVVVTERRRHDDAGRKWGRWRSDERRALADERSGRALRAFEGGRARHRVAPPPHGRTTDDREREILRGRGEDADLVAPRGQVRE